ncbi:MAG: MFS transporter, partial [Lewinella sp.]|nr:MFS transporter [Lewinella sp.]
MFRRTLDLYREAFSGLRREVWYLSIVLLINRSGAMVIPFLTVYLTSKRGFSLEEAGLIMSSFGVGSLVGSYVGGWITDRFGFYRVQFFTLIGSGLLFAGVGQLDSFWGLVLGIFALSTVTDAFRPANQAALAYYSHPRNRARAYGLLRLAVNLGFSMGPVIGGIVIATLSYRWLFVINGISVLMAALAFRLLLPPGRQGEAEPVDTDEPVHGVSAYRNLRYLAFVGFTMLGATAFMQVFNSLPVFLKDELLFSEAQIGGLIAINGLLIVVLEMPLVHKVGELYRPLPVMMIGYLLIAAGYLFLEGAGLSLLFPLLYIFMLTMGEMLSMPFSSTYAAAQAPVSRRGEYMGLLSIGWAGAFIIAPTLGLRWAGHFGFNSLWGLAAVLSLISALGMWLLNYQPSRRVRWRLGKLRRRLTGSKQP